MTESSKKGWKASKRQNMGHWMPPALLPSNSESHFHHLLLPVPCFQLRIPALSPAAESANCAQLHIGGTKLQGNFWENCSSCFSSNYIHFLTLHCIWFSIANDHNSFSCFWASEATLSKAKKLSATTAKEIFWKKKKKKTLKKSSLHPTVLSDCCQRGKTPRTAVEELLLIRKY